MDKSTSTIIIKEVFFLQLVFLIASFECRRRKKIINKKLKYVNRTDLHVIVKRSCSKTLHRTWNMFPAVVVKDTSQRGFLPQTRFKSEASCAFCGVSASVHQNQIIKSVEGLWRAWLQTEEVIQAFRTGTHLKVAEWCVWHLYVLTSCHSRSPARNLPSSALVDRREILTFSLSTVKKIANQRTLF